MLTAVKKAEDANGLIFRVYEWAGKEATVEFHVPPGATGATVTNLMEKPEGDPLAVTGDVVKVPDSSVRDSDGARGLSERWAEAVGRGPWAVNGELRDRLQKRRLGEWRIAQGLKPR